jgi:SlyX protein
MRVTGLRVSSSGCCRISASQIQKLGMTHEHPRTSEPATRTAGARLDELEIKASYAEDLLEQLNLTVFRQQQQIETLQRQIEHLRNQLPERDTAMGTAQRDAREERPPHY